jgi:hypothetical protein
MATASPLSRIPKDRGVKDGHDVAKGGGRECDVRRTEDSTLSDPFLTTGQGRLKHREMQLASASKDRFTMKSRVHKMLLTDASVPFECDLVNSSRLKERGAHHGL